MSDLTEFEPRMAGASVTKTAEPLGFSRATISRAMTNFKKHGKTSKNWCNSGQTSKLSDRDRCALKSIRKHRTITSKATAGVNQHPNSPFRPKPTKTVVHLGLIS